MALGPQWRQGGTASIWNVHEMRQPDGHKNHIQDCLRPGACTFAAAWIASPQHRRQAQRDRKRTPTSTEKESTPFDRTRRRASSNSAMPPLLESQARAWRHGDTTASSRTQGWQRHKCKHENAHCYAVIPRQGNPASVRRRRRALPRFAWLLQACKQSTK